MVNTLYNNNYQIVQTPHIVISSRRWCTTRASSRRNDKEFAQAAHRRRRSGGRRFGRVVGERHVRCRDDQRQRSTAGALSPIYLPEGEGDRALHEVRPKQIFYAYQVEDPPVYTQAWRAEIGLNARER